MPTPSNGRELEIMPVEESHALQSLTLTVSTSGSVIEIGPDGELGSPEFGGRV